MFARRNHEGQDTWSLGGGGKGKERLRREDCQTIREGLKKTRLSSRDYPKREASGQSG